MDSGQYQPQVVRCRLNTGKKTIPELREAFKGQGLTYRNFENIQKGGDLFDGLEVLLSLWAYDDHKYFHLYSWKKDIDEKVMMAMFYFEQAHPVPSYKGQLDNFIADWKAGTYDPGAAFVFNPQDVEVLEVVQEERKVQRAEEEEPPPPPKTPRRRRKKKRRK